jgi:DNA-binding response OmpR family regulator
MSAAHARPQVLVVDDEAPIREIVRDVLDDEGYDVTMAEDGAEALRMCRVSCPDVILLDLNMPRLDGRSFLAAFRLEHHCGTHVVVFSAVTNARRIATEMKADGFLFKPFVISELAALVRSHVT